MAQVTGGAQPIVKVERLQPMTLTDFQKRDNTSVTVLLTPVVAPVYSAASNALIDPFEPLGRSLATDQNRIRHVPYVASQGLTSYHIAFIERAQFIVFVLSDGTPGNAQLDSAKAIRSACGNKPIIVISVCMPPLEQMVLDAVAFPNFLSVAGYHQAALEAVTVLFRAQQGAN